MVLKFLKTRLATNILLVLTFIALCWTAYFFRYWSGYDFTFGLTGQDFNNWVTPIAAILSVILFVYIALKQNKITLGQIVRDNVQKEYEVLEKKLEIDISMQIISVAGVMQQSDFDKIKEFGSANSLNFTVKLLAVMDKLFSSSQYLEDSDKKEVKELGYYWGRDYNWELRILSSIFLTRTARFDLVEDFLTKLESNTNLLDVDKTFFKNKVATSLLEKYFLFIEHETRFQIPDIREYGKDFKVKWVYYSSTNISRYYETLKRLVGQVPHSSASVSLVL